MASVRAEVEIDAPAERVWKILTDLEAYPAWNPFTPRVESTLRVGDPIHLHVRLRRARLAHRVEIVSAVDEPRRLCWGMVLGAPALLAAERCQVLTPLSPHRTRYVTEDTIRGWLTPLVMRLFGPPMQRGFEDVARALKQRAEAPEREGGGP